MEESEQESEQSDSAISDSAIEELSDSAIEDNEDNEEGKELVDDETISTQSLLDKLRQPKAKKMKSEIAESQADSKPKEKPQKSKLVLPPLKPSDKLQVRRTVKKCIQFSIQKMKRKEKKMMQEFPKAEDSKAEDSKAEDSKVDLGKISKDIEILKGLSVAEVSELALSLYIDSKKPKFDADVAVRKRELINLILHSNNLKKVFDEVNLIRKKRMRKDEKRLKKEKGQNEKKTKGGKEEA